MAEQDRPAIANEIVEINVFSTLPNAEDRIQIGKFQLKLDSFLSELKQEEARANKEKRSRMSAGRDGRGVLISSPSNLFLDASDENSKKNTYCFAGQ